MRTATITKARSAMASEKGRAFTSIGYRTKPTTVSGSVTGGTGKAQCAARLLAISTKANGSLARRAAKAKKSHLKANTQGAGCAASATARELVLILMDRFSKAGSRTDFLTEKGL